MSAIFAALAAAALAAVPPSLGSEPNVVGFDYIAPATPAPAGATTLAASLGSEPLVAGFDELAYPAAGRPDEREPQAATYAVSLGSEPTVVGFEGVTYPPAREPDTRLACACPCK